MSLVLKLSQRRKRQVIDIFFAVMRPDPAHTLLDLGGPSHDQGTLTKFFKTVFALNINPGDLGDVFAVHSQEVRILGDGTALPLRNASIDYVFCDQVIEHIAQALRLSFVREIERVSRRGFLLSTPNFWFPFEPHYMMPFWQYLPERAKRRISSFVKLGWIDGKTYHPIFLPTASEMRGLLPDATVKGLSFGPWMPETLIAYQTKD